MCFNVRRRRASHSKGRPPARCKCYSDHGGPLHSPGRREEIAAGGREGGGEGEKGGRDRWKEEEREGGERARERGRKGVREQWCKSAHTAPGRAHESTSGEGVGCGGVGDGGVRETWCWARQKERRIKGQTRKKGQNNGHKNKGQKKKMKAKKKASKNEKKMQQSNKVTM